MDGIKNFLESSTIHGLSYISSSKALPVRLFWILVVLGGFTVAGLLIHSSFQAWEENPVDTTIETLPISQLEFPMVNVCPPANTLTSLNYDIVKAENNKLTEPVKDDLIKFADEWVQDREFENIYTEQSAFKEENKYFNLYSGLTHFELAYQRPTETVYKYSMSTADTAGFISTPLLGQDMDLARYKLGEVVYKYYIHLPSNITLPGLSLVLQLQVDLKETPGGEETVVVEPPGRNKREKMQYNVNLPLVRTYQVSEEFRNNNLVYIRYYRNIDQASLDTWDTGRITGFSLHWYFKDDKGERVDIEPEIKEPEDAKTKGNGELFMRMVNIVQLGLAGNTMDNIWDTVKDVRIEWINMDPGFSPNEVLLYDTVTYKLLLRLEEKLKIKSSSSQPIYKSLISQPNLETAFQMFLYLANHPSMLLSRRYNKDFRKFFEKSSARTIIELVLKINKLKNEKRARQEFWHVGPIEKMVTTLNTELHLQVGRIDSTVLSRTELLPLIGNAEFGSIRKYILDCLQLGNCSQVTNYLQILGRFGNFPSTSF